MKGQATIKAAMNAGLESVTELMQRWAAQHNVPWLDVREAFRARGPTAGLYLGDGIHFTPAGNELLARLVFERVFQPRCVQKSADGDT